jgi:hypothetical protein
MNILKIFSKRKKYKYRVGDMVKVHPDPSLPNHIRGAEALLEQANGIGQISEITELPNNLYY